MPELIQVKPNTPEWLELRRTGIGGSDAAAVLGLSKWKSPFQLWQEKRGEAPPVNDNWFMQRGRALEPVIRQHFANVMGYDVMLPEGAYRHDTHKFMLVNLDGFTEANGCRRGFEAKTARSRDGWGEPGTDEVPQEYLFQVHHAMIVTGFPAFDISVSIAGDEPKIYHVEEDKELHQLIIEGEAEFWSMVEGGVAPEVTTVDDAVAKYRKSKAQSLEADEALCDKVADLKRIRQEVKRREADEEAVRAAILIAMGENDTLTHMGDTLATWKSAKDGKRFDSVAFRAAHPTLYEEFCKPTEGSRRFLLK